MMADPSFSKAYTDLVAAIGTAIDKRCRKSNDVLQTDIISATATILAGAIGQIADEQLRTAIIEDVTQQLKNRIYVAPKGHA